MAIAKMNKVTVIGVKEAQEDILKKLRNLAFFQVEDVSHIVEDEEYKDIFHKEDPNSEIGTINQKLVAIEKAISNIKKYNKIKKSIFDSKEYYKELSEEIANKSFIKVEEINDLADKIEKYTEKIKDLKNYIIELEPWHNFTISGDLKKLDYIKIILGTISLKYKKEQLEMELKKSKVDCSVDTINKSKTNEYLVIVCKEENQSEIRRILKKFEFNEKYFNLVEYSISEIIQNTKKEICELEKQIENHKEKVKPMLLKVFENLYDYYLSERDLKIIEKNIVTTNNTFYLEGWIPEGCKIETDDKFIIKIREEEESDTAPVLVKDNKFFEPFQSITNMYSVPNKSELDPNPIMAIFYIIFFGLMLSDAGYGLLLAIICFFIIKKKKYARGEGSLIKILAICGVSATLWGFFFGSFFGDLVPLKAVINPLKDVMPLMGLALLFGIIHIYAGMFMKAIQLIKQKKVFDAICDIGFWYLLLTGVFLLVIPIVAGNIGIWSEVGKYLAIAGVVGVILTGGRKEKNIIKKFTKGISSLYDITSYLSDVLSYSRLMALCLSTGVIAQVVNLLGGLVGPIPAIIVGIIGHGFNLANSALGSYVHTSRLQYVEFFGKFYEGGGREFKPFKYKNKYTRIKEEF